MGGPVGAALRVRLRGGVDRRGGAARPPMRRGRRPTFTECKASLIAGRLERFLTSSFPRSGGVRSSSECLGSPISAVLMRSQTRPKPAAAPAPAGVPKGLPPHAGERSTRHKRDHRDATGEKSSGSAQDCRGPGTQPIGSGQRRHAPPLVGRPQEGAGLSASKFPRRCISNRRRAQERLRLLRRRGERQNNPGPAQKATRRVL